jgi:hypothetical protein
MLLYFLGQKSQLGKIDPEIFSLLETLLRNQIDKSEYLLISGRFVYEKLKKALSALFHEIKFVANENEFDLKQRLQEVLKHYSDVFVF